MANEIQGIYYETALANLRASSLELRGDLPEKNELLSQFHPDYQANVRVKLPIGPNTGDYCHPDLAKLLISHPLIDDYDLSGAEHLNTDVLVIGGGGAGAAAALSATEAGARVIMANKPKWFGRMCSGQERVQRLHITHWSKVSAAAPKSPETTCATPFSTCKPLGQARLQPPQ